MESSVTNEQSIFNWLNILIATGNYRSNQSLECIQYFTSKGLRLYILKVWNIGFGS